jgi:hypothetical protein
LKTLKDAVPLVMPELTKLLPEAKPFQGIAANAIDRGLDLALRRSEARAAARKKTNAKAPVKAKNTNQMRAHR